MNQSMQLKDPLTGVYTRAALEERLQEETARARRSGQPFALALLDLDHFKSVNDAFGHARGDEVLIEFTRRALHTIRASDLIFRYGGDEFVLLLPDTGKDDAIVFSQRLLDAVRLLPFAGTPPLSLTISMGVAIFPIDGQTPQTLFELADQRNYQAKRAGRGRAICEEVVDAEEVSVEGPSRLIERDRAINTLYQFLEALSNHQRGLLRVIGSPGCGITRFLAEVRKAAQLQGYGVLELHGNPALKDRAYGVLSEARKQWPELPFPSSDTERFAAMLQQRMAEQGYSGLIVTLDRLADMDRTTINFLHTLFLSDAFPWFALVYGTTNPGEHRKLPREAPLREQITLEPISLAGLRTWLRHGLNWEAPREFLDWFHQETGGRPGHIRRGLTYLLSQDMLIPSASGWRYAENFTTIPLSAQIARQMALPPNNLPSGMKEFIGREADIERLKQLIMEQPLVAVLGAGGLGKTRLAIQSAAESLAEFADGVWFVSLTALSSADFLVYAIAEVVGCPLANAYNPRVQLLTYLSSRTMLLVLDNFEHLREGVPLLREILQQAPGVRLLVTSRDALDLPDATRFELHGLPFPGDETEENIEDYSSVQLFLHSARHTYSNFIFTPQDRPFVARICRLVEGMPLGIELAAAWVRTFSCESIATHIERNLVFLTSNQPEMPARHFSLSVIIESFWTLFSEGEQLILRQLSLFRGGFRREAARQVAGASPFFLDALVVKGYLRWTPQGRYEIHELLRQYAEEQLQEREPELLQTQERHCSYYLMFVQQREAVLSISRRALDEINTELENVRAAWDWAVDHVRINELGYGSSGLARFYELTGLLSEGTTAFNRAVECLEAQADAAAELPEEVALVLGRLLAEIAHFLSVQGEYSRAIQVARRIERLGQETHLTSLQAWGAYQQGEALYSLGNHDEAQRWLQQSLTLARAAQARSTEADALYSLGRIAMQQHDTEASIYYHQALAIYRLLGHRWGETRVLEALSNPTDSHATHAGDSAAALHRRISREIGS